MEILFRGKCVKNGEWVEGYYTFYPGGFSEISAPEHVIRDTRQFISKMYFVDPETVSQYTGLTDKHGRKIFEWDICDRKKDFPEIVTHHNGDWTLDYSYASGHASGHDYCNLGFYVKERGGVEVVGNIFDNPELVGWSAKDESPEYCDIIKSACPYEGRICRLCRLYCEYEEAKTRSKGKEQNALKEILKSGGGAK